MNAASYLQPLYVLIRHRPRYALAVPSGPAGRRARAGQLRAGLLATRVFHFGGGGFGLMMAVFGFGGRVRHGDGPTPWQALTATIGWRALTDRRPPPQESPADNPVAELPVTEASLSETA